MVRRSTLWLVPILVLTAACNRSEKPLAEDNGPFLTIERIHNFSLEPGSTVVTWDLNGRGMKEMTAHLLVFRDGKRLPGKEIVCRWDEESPAEMHAEMVYLLQDGDAFGSKNKRMANLEITFKAGEPDLRIVRGGHIFVEGDFKASESTGLTSRERLKSPDLEIPYATRFMPEYLGGLVMHRNLQDMLLASKNRLVTVGIGLESRPADKN